MAIDRTKEFHAAVATISSRLSKSPSESRRLLSADYNDRSVKLTPKSEFSRIAAKIGHDINMTGAKLQRLAQRTSPSNICLTSSDQEKITFRRQIDSNLRTDIRYQARYFRI